MKKILLVVLLSLFVCSIAHAAKFSGKWGGKLPPQSKSVIMNLKQKGKSIQGKIISSNGKYNVQGRIYEDIVNCSIIFIETDCEDCGYNYSATMELIDDNTLLLIYDGVDCYGDEIGEGEAEFIRY